MTLDELRKDLCELKILLDQATRSRVKDVLSVAQHKLESEILVLEQKQTLEPKGGSTSKVQKAVPETKRYIAELHEYAWDQSDKFVKIFVTLNGINNLSESDVDAAFTENSLKLSVRNLNDKDYFLTINNLLSSIDVEKSYHKVKTDMIAVYMKKQNEGFHWSHLTVTEKRLKEIKDSRFKGEDHDADDSKGDPTAGIMNLMKNMYQSGDSEMKRMIAKAWTESQEKGKEKMMEM